MNTPETDQNERPTPETDAVWRYPASFDSNEKVVQISLAQKLELERDEAREELSNIESLMFGGLVQFTPKDRLAWRVFDAVMAMKKERDEAREDATNYYARIGELESERDELKKALEAAK